MRKKNVIKIIAFLSLTALLLSGIFVLYSLRYRGSDLYAFYSSFRADRMGTKALYESLKSFEQLQVARNLRPLYEIRDSRKLCLFVLGCPSGLFENNFKRIEKCALDGARVVVSFAPCACDYEDDERRPVCAKKVEAKKAKAKKKDKADKSEIKPLEPCKSGVSGVSVTSLQRPVRMPAKAFAPKDIKLPSFKVFSSNCFKIERRGWKTLYELRGEPAVIERKYKSGGSIVFCADSYLFSNESLAEDKNAQVLLLLIDGRTYILFDETHFGALKSRNLVWLAKKYNLTVFLIVLSITLILFIWRNVLLPRNTSAGGEQQGIAEDFSDSSLVNMLRMNYNVKELLAECFNEFKNSRAGKNISRRKFSALESIIKGNGKIVEKYNNAVNEYKKRESLRND